MRTLGILFFPLLLTIPLTSHAQKIDTDARAKEIAPYLDEDVLGVAHVDLSRPDAAPLLGMVLDLAVPSPTERAERGKRLSEALSAVVKLGGRDLYFLLTLADAKIAPIVIMPLGDVKVRDLPELKRHLEASGLAPGSGFETHGSVIVGGTEAARKRLRTVKAAPRPELAQAFAAAGDSTARLVLLPTDDHRRVVEELMPELPKELGGGASTILTRGIRWLALGANGPPKLSLGLTIQSADAAAAKKLHSWFANMIQALGANPEVRQLFPDFPKIAPSLVPTIAGDRLTLTLEEKTLTALLLPALEKAQEASARTVSMNNLKQIGLAMHNYHDANRTFPASASYDKDGKSLLSWRVHLLPYLEQDALYKEFKLDEPWDSPHNKKLIAKMPKFYKSPLSGVADAGKTTYLVPYGKETIFFGAKGTDIRAITDGTSNTILAVEAADDHAVIWTKPEDLPFDPKQPDKGLFDKKRPVSFTLFADGSVRAISATIRLEILRALFTKDGGEVVGDF